MADKQAYMSRVMNIYGKEVCLAADTLDLQVHWLSSSCEDLIRKKVNLMSVSSEGPLMLDTVLPNLATDGGVQNTQDVSWVDSLLDRTITTTAIQGRGKPLVVRALVTKEIYVEDGTDFAFYVVHMTDERNREAADRSLYMSYEIMNNVSTPAVLVDGNGTVILFNSSAESLFGWTFHELRGKNVNVLCPEKVRRRHDSFLQRATQPDYSVISETNVMAIHKKGHKVNIALKPSKVLYDGKTFFVAIITENESSIARIREQAATQAHAQAVFDSIPEGVVTITQHGIIETSNMTFLKMIQADGGTDITGGNISQFMPEPYRSNHDMYLRNYREKGVRNILDKPQDLVACSLWGDMIHVRLFVKEMIIGTGTRLVGILRDISDEMSKRSVVEKSQLMLKSLVYNAVDPIIIITDAGIVENFSKAAEGLWGYKQSEVIGRPVKILMPEPYASEHDGYLRRYRETGVRRVINKAIEVAAQTSHGSCVAIELSVSEIQTGSCHYFSAIARDLTEKKHRMMRITEAHERMLQIVNNSFDAIITADMNGKIILFSKVAHQLFGTTDEDVVGENLSILMPPPHDKAHDSYLTAYAITGEKKVIGKTIEVRAVQLKTGVTFDVSLTVSEVTMSSARFFVGVMRDITEGLAKSREIEETMNSIMDGLVHISSSGTILSVNSAVVSMFGYKSDADLVGKNVNYLMPEPYASEHSDYLLNYARTGVPKVMNKTQLLSGLDSKGLIFPLDLVVSECFIDQDITFMGFIRNATEDREIQARKEKDLKKTASILSNSPDGFIMISDLGTIEDVNPATLSLFGYRSQEDLLGRNIKILMPNPFSDQHDQYLEDYRRTGIRKVIGVGRNVPCLRHDRTTFQAELNVSEITVASSTVYAAMLRDVSLRQAHIESMLEVQRFSSTIVNAIVDPVLSIDPDGRILIWNAAAKRVFGYDGEEILGCDVSTLMFEPQASEHGDYLRKYSQTRKRTVIGRKTIVRGKTKWDEGISLQLTVTEHVNSSNAMYLGIMRDVKDAVSKDEEVSAIMDSVPDAIIMIDTHGMIKMCNKATVETFKYPEENLLNQDINILMPEPYKSEHGGYLRRFRETGTTTIVGKTQIVSGQDKNGVIIPIELLITKAEIAGEMCFIGVLNDIQERLESDHRQEKINMRSKEIFENNPNGLITISETGIIQEANYRVRELFGYSHEMMVGRNVSMLMPLPHSENHDNYLKRYLATGISRVLNTSTSIVCRRNNGKTFPAELTVYEVRVASSISWCGLIMDVSEMKDLEAKTKERESANNLVLDAVTKAVVGIDDYGIVQTFNSYAEKLFKHKRDFILGKNVSMIMPPPHCWEHDNYLKHYRKTRYKKVIGATQTLSAVDAEGKVFPIELNISELHDQNTNQYSYLAIINTIEELYMMVEKITSIMNSIPDGMIVINTLGSIQSANLSIGKMFLTSPDQVVGQNVSSLMPEPYRSEHDGYLKRFASGGKSLKDSILGKRQVLSAQRIGDGKIFPVSLFVTEAVIANERVFTGIICDESDKTADNYKRDKQQKKLQGIIESSSSCIVLADEYGVLLDVNRVTEETFGYDQGELYKKNVSVLMPPEVAEKHDGYMMNFRDTGIRKVLDQVLEVTALKANGDEFPIELRVTEVVQQGSQRYFSGVIRDMSEYTNAKQMRVNRLEQFRLITDSLIVGLVVIDHTGNIVTCNAQLKELTGYEVDECVGQNVSMLMPSTIAQRHDSFLMNYRRKKIKTSEVVNKTRIVDVKSKDETIRRCSLHVTVFLDDQKKCYFVGQMKDVADVLKKEALHTRTVNAVQGGVIGIGRDGIIFEVNTMLCKIFGYERDHLLGRNVSNLMPEPFSSQHDQFLDNYIQTGESKIMKKPTKLMGMRRDRTTFALMLLLKGFGHGSESFFVATIHDITETNEFSNRAVAEENRMAGLLDNLTKAIVATDSLGLIELGNRALAELFLYDDVKSVLGMSITSLMTPGDGARHNKYMKNYIRSGVANGMVGFSRVVRCLRRNNETFMAAVRVTSFTVRGELHFVGCFSPLAEKDAAKQSKSEALLRRDSVLASYPHGVIRTNQMGVVTYVNEPALRLVGLKSEDVIGRNVKMFVPAPFNQMHDEYIQKYLSSGESTKINKTTEVRAQHRFGGTVLCKMTISEVVFDEVSRSFLAVLEDMSAGDKQSEAIRQAQHTAEQVVNAAGVAAIVTDSEGIVELASLTALQMFEMPRSSVVGHRINTIIPDYTNSLIGTNKTIVEEEVEGVRSDGSKMTLLLTISSANASNEDKSVVTFTHTCKEMKSKAYSDAMEGDMNTITQIWRRLTNAVSPIIAITRDNKVDFVNESAESMTGYTSSELRGKDVSILMPAGDAEKHKRGLEDFVARGLSMQGGIDSRQIAGTVLHKSGAMVRVNFKVHFVFTNDDEIKLLAVFTDAGEMMLAEDLKTMSIRQLTLLSNSSNTGILLCNAEGIIIHCNKQLAALFGYMERRDLIGKNITIMMTAEDARIHHEYVTHYLMLRARGESVRTAEVTGCRADGSVIGIEYNLSMAENDTPLFAASIRRLHEGSMSFAGYQKAQRPQMVAPNLQPRPHGSTNRGGVAVAKAKRTTRTMKM